MDTSTLANQVYQVLRERILQGVYPPGQKLNLAELARDLQVSNTPIREAIARLERIGLIEVIPYCGPKVKRLNRSQVADVFDVRIALEELALHLVMQKGDPDDLQGMAAAINAHEQAYEQNDADGMIEADRAFHDALVQASGNSVLLEMLPTLSDRTRLLIELNMPRSDQKNNKAASGGFQGHQRILQALREGDEAVATQALRHELTIAKKHLLAQMQKTEG